MAKTKRFYYECVYPTDLGYYALDQRRERWVRQGRSDIAKPTMHCVRCYPSKGLNARGEQIPADYIVTDQTLGKQYTEEIAKQVSRPDFEHPGQRFRKMREKVSKVKFVLLDPEDVTTYVRSHAYDYGAPQFGKDAKGNDIQVSGWHAQMFETINADVTLDKEVELNAKIGRGLILAGKES